MLKNIISVDANGLKRENEPITIGIPFPQSVINKNDRLLLLNDKNESLPLQVTPTVFWPDKSIKWVVADFQASVGENRRKFTIQKNGAPSQKNSHIIVRKSEDSFSVDTGKAKFFLDKKVFRPFLKVLTSDGEMINGLQSKTIITDQDDVEYMPVVHEIVEEFSGQLRNVIKIEGVFVSNDNVLANYTSRIHFYFRKAFVKIDFTLWNPKPSRHESGLWDLGDPGSIFFKDLSVFTCLQGGDSGKVQWLPDITKDINLRPGQSSLFSIYQDSSGGRNWKSKNHVNHLGKIPLSFKGFRVVDGKENIFNGDRANPILCLGDNKKTISCAIKKFWQNFPKSIDVEDNKLIIRLFPKHFKDLHELQGGEQKMHSMFLEYGPHKPELMSLLNPSRVRLLPEYISKTAVFPYATLLAEFKDEKYENLIQNVVEGKNSFFERRETIDEFGWRNFGEAYADHEAVGYVGEYPLISHYNNQYDFIYSAIRQFVLKADFRWFELMDDMSYHVVDIDIYRTNKDRSEYNNALFWHTNHYLDAATCTHRSESSDHLNYSDPGLCGGGPDLEHNYSTGLMYHYLLTGEQSSKEAVIMLADWVVRLMDGPETFIAFLHYVKKNLSLWKQAIKGMHVRYDEFPFTRESGNSISVLLDAFQLTTNRIYLKKASDIIQGCLHPNDTIDDRDLLNAELKWSYTACLQGIGKFIDVKYSLGEIDDIFYYSIACLRHYAKWMRDNESPYLDKSEALEYPNETWPAQDLRKSCVFYFAAKYSEGDLRDEFLEKAESYYDYAINKVFEFETKTLVRPIVLLLQNGYMHHYFGAKKDEKVVVNFPIDPDFLSEDGNLTRVRIIKICYSHFKRIIKSFSFKKEMNWVRCRLYKHI